MAIKQKQKYINQHKINPNYKKEETGQYRILPEVNPGVGKYPEEIEPPSYKKDTHLKPGEPNPKDIGIDGYEYEEDILEDYEPSKTKEF